MTANEKRLIEQVGVAETLGQTTVSEDAWIDVIRKMDEVYADLVHHQLELEAKNVELEQAHQFIRSVLTSMNDVLIVCNRNGDVTQVNNALLKLSGRDESAVLYKPLSKLFDWESHDKILFQLQDSCCDVVSDCEVLLSTADGGVIQLALNCSPHLDHDGRQQGMVLVGRPVGELRQAYDALHKAHQELQQTQQQLVQSEKMASLGRLVAGVAHELNNPISFVFGNMHALKRYGERISRYLTAIEDGADQGQLAELRDALRIDHIINDMASLIDGTLEGAERVSDIVQDLRRYSGAQIEALSRFDLVPLIETSVHWVLSSERQNIEVRYQLPPALEIRSRKGHLQQILVNLIQNAVDVMEGQEQSCLEIGCQQDSSGIVITVRDHGRGIAAETLCKVFDPFFTTKPVGNGTGLGLSISYGLAQKIGGELRVENHPQGGAVFSLLLPLVMEQHDE